MSEHNHLPARGRRLFTNIGNPAEATELSIKTLDKPVAGDQFGLLKIEITQVMIAAAEPKVLALSLVARAALWEFFLLTNLSQNPDEISIVDVDPQRSESPIQFRAVAAADTAEMPMQERLKNQLLARYPGAICVHNVSQQQITGRQQGVRNIQLRHNISRLLDNLPNPSLKNISRFTPQGGDSDQAQDSYITHSFSKNGT